jgi:acyl-CoA synthetase (AMP-forming)/AMP-acid ligase II
MVDDSLADAVRQRLNITIEQGYGMTEASPVTHDADYLSPQRVGTVGRSSRITASSGLAFQWPLTAQARLNEYARQDARVVLFGSEDSSCGT